MVSTKWYKGIENLKEVEELRKKVFVEEQNVDINMIMDEYDNMSFNVIAFENHNPVGTGRLIYKDSQYQLGRIAVLKEYRGKKYGDLIVRLLIRKAIDVGAKEVHLHSQIHAKDFYKKIGFIEYGKPFFEAGIEHINMLRKGDIGGCC